VSNFNNNAQTQNDPVSQPTDNGFVGNAQNNMDANSQLPQPVQPVQTTIVKGLDEEDVLNLVEPMGRQINALIDAVSQQNEYIQTLPTKVDEVSSSLSDENLSIIKGAIDTGLKRTEDSFKEDTAQLRIEIEALAKKIQKLETKPAQEQRRQMTMVTSIEGKVRVQIDGTDEIQEIVNGSVLRGYGKVDKVGPWGCLYLEGGGTYEPTRASCAPQN
jgi:predicted RNase H-like nuclease (RuvC/YqgF family)